MYFTSLGHYKGFRLGLSEGDYVIGPEIVQKLYSHISLIFGLDQIIAVCLNDGEDASGGTALNLEIMYIKFFAVFSHNILGLYKGPVILDRIVTVVLTVLASPLFKRDMMVGRHMPVLQDKSLVLGYILIMC